ncbi:MAG: hypothetical protein RLZZ108_57, partial [Actinomycetota bacterium]
MRKMTRGGAVLKPSKRPFVERSRKLVLGIAATLTAALGFATTPQVSFAAIAITPSDYFATFNGTDQYVEAPSQPVPSSGDFTVSAWVMDTDLSSAQQSIVSQGTDSNSFHIGTWGTSQNVRVGAWDPTYTTSTGQVVNVKFPQNRWFHVAVTKGGSTAKLFINGEQVATTTNAAMVPSGGTNFRIGRQWGTWVEYWKGRIDEVQVWNTDRSASIATDMNTRADVSSANLLAYYDFNAGSDRVVANVKAGSAQSTNGYFFGTAPVYTDVKQVSNRSNNVRTKVVTFERTYLPSNGGWVIPQGVTQLQVLTIGGGGGGGANYGGGGGAGGFRESTLSVLPGALTTVQVGFGGRASITNTVQTAVAATSGGSSIFGSQTSLGGGFGASSDVNLNAPGTGGSGGGNVSLNSALTAGGAGTAGQGNNGGASQFNNNVVGAGGGGGAGSAGGDGSSSLVRGGNGGAGKASSITGTSVIYAGGGGGGSHSNGNACTTATGGSGGGGNGGVCGATNNGSDGTPGLGGGGGGGSVYNGRGSNGGYGGTGIVIVSYTEVTPTANSGKCDVFSYTRNIGGVNYTINEIQATGSCTWDVPAGINTIDIFGVGGGGGGAANVGSGGSGGGSFNVTGVSVTPGAGLPVVVGAGGAGAPDGISGTTTINQDGGAGGNSTIVIGGTTYTAGGGRPGQTKWSNNVCNGSGAVDGTVAGGTAGTGGNTGGIGGAMATNSTGGHATAGANGYASNFTGDYRIYGSGGGGAGWGSSLGAVGGTYSGVGGNGSAAGTGASLPNSGAGGSGGGDGCKPGGSGAAGVVMVRYVASNAGVALGIDRTAIAVPTAAATRVLVAPRVGIKDGAGNPVSSAGVVVTASGTGVGGVVTATTDSSGVATFPGLTVTSSTTSINFAAPSLQGISQPITTVGVSGNLTVSTSASSGGYFENGVWLATTDNTATTLNVTELQNALATGDVVLPSKAFVSVAANISLSGSCGNLTIAATASSTGAVSFANSVSVLNACPASDITVLATTNITTGSNVTIQTARNANSHLVLWSDTDRATTAGGYIAFGQNTFLNTSGGVTTEGQTGGGGIWIAGGAMGSDGYPAGNAFSNTAGTAGLDFDGSTGSATGFRVFTGGGNLVMRGESSTSLGLRGRDGTTIDSGVGSINIVGLATTSSSANPHPIEFVIGNAFPIKITSAKPSGDAITLSGTSTTTASDSIPISVLGGSASNQTTLSATGANGNIVMTGVGGTNTTEGMRLNWFNAYTVGGNITIDAGVKGFAYNNSGASGQVNIGAASGSTSTGTFTLRTDRMLLDTDPFNVRMAKAVVEPSSTNFSAAQTFPFSGWAFSGTTDLRLGKAAGTASDITLSNFSFPGNVEMYGRTLTTSGSNTITNNFDLYGTTVEITGTQMVSGVGKRFMAKATGNVRAATGSTVRTYGGLLSLWADSDSTGGGSVVLKSAAGTGAFLCTVNVGLCNGSATTGGGDIVLGGGAVETDTTLSDYQYRPGSYATGSTTDNESGTASGTGAADRYNGGVYLGTAAISNGSTQLYSAGGNITVRGKTNTGALTVWAAAITSPGGLTVDSGAGKILFDAWYAGSSIGGTMEFNAWGGTTNYKSTNTADDSIRFLARSTNLVSNLFGGNVGTTFTNTSGGGVLFQVDAINDWFTPKFNVTGKV